MDVSTDRYADARNLMVDGQVRPNRVNDRRLLEAMRRLPRERFVPPQAVARAYADEDVPLGRGRMLLAPMSIARLVQLGAPRAGDRALVVGCATGYGAALLAACGASVTALEEDEALLALARSALADVAGVTLVEGKLREGWQRAAPYDLVLIEGAAEAVPAALAAQVRVPGGRLVGVLATGEHMGRAVLAEPSVGGLSVQPAFDCAAPLLPPLRQGRGFVF
jgi:protein-L-isoaspartate(D-aspartate) O-methyltransferase